MLPHHQFITAVPDTSFSPPPVHASGAVSCCIWALSYTLCFSGKFFLLISISQFLGHSEWVQSHRGNLSTRARYRTPFQCLMNTYWVGTAAFHEPHAQEAAEDTWGVHLKLYGWSMPTDPQPFKPYGWTGARRRPRAPNPTLRGARHLWCPSVRLCHPLVGDAQSFAVPPESRHRLELPRRKVSGFSFQRWAKLSSLKHLLHLPFPFVQLAIVCWAAMKKY